MQKGNLFLCGFMGAGKTTVGKILAKRLGKVFFDADQVILDMLGMPIKDIFQKYGERYFRTNETKAIKQICNRSNSVVSLGGGALECLENIEAVKNSGRVIFLDVNFDTVLGRLENDLVRPLLDNKSAVEVRSLYEKRRKIYLQNADVIIDANSSPMETCNRIINSINIPFG